MPQSRYSYLRSRCAALPRTTPRGNSVSLNTSFSWGTPARALHYARLLSRRGLRCVGVSANEESDLDFGAGGGRGKKTVVSSKAGAGSRTILEGDGRGKNLCSILVFGRGESNLGQLSQTLPVNTCNCAPYTTPDRRIVLESRRIEGGGNRNLREIFGRGEWNAGWLQKVSNIFSLHNATAPCTVLDDTSGSGRKGQPERMNGEDESLARGWVDFVTGTGGEKKNHSQDSASSRPRGVEPRAAAVTMLHEETEGPEQVSYDSSSSILADGYGVQRAEDAPKSDRPRMNMSSNRLDVAARRRLVRVARTVSIEAACVIGHNSGERVRKEMRAIEGVDCG
ncbi:hypothetical protein B0H11DRAFT_1911348 [Mycena galericulata]|nr:hypothetical protein B0H11DRAFT_1911348 [Mycena galericulata]